MKYFMDVASCLAPVVKGDVWFARKPSSESKEEVLKALYYMIEAVKASGTEEPTSSRVVPPNEEEQQGLPEWRDLPSPALTVEYSDEDEETFGSPVRGDVNEEVAAILELDLAELSPKRAKVE